MNLSKAQRIAIPIFAVVVIIIIAVATATTADLETGVSGTVWALMPPIIAIGLALITKEVYISLFVGIAAGAFLSVGGFGHPVAAVETIFGEAGRFLEYWYSDFPGYLRHHCYSDE